MCEGFSRGTLKDKKRREPVKARRVLRLQRETGDE